MEKTMVASYVGEDGNSYDVYGSSLQEMAEQLPAGTRKMKVYGEDTEQLRGLIAKGEDGVIWWSAS